MRLRLRFLPGVDEAEALDALSKALARPLSGTMRALAAGAANLNREHFTGAMTRLLPQYEESYQLIQDALKGTRGRRRQDLLEQRRRLRDRTKWLLRYQFITAYEAQFRSGRDMAGNGSPLHPNEREVLRRLVNNEMEFALNALLDAETGEYDRPMEWRGKLYGNALDEARWMGFLYGDLSADRFVAWKIGKSEHCIDCLYLAGELKLLEQELLRRIDARGGTPTEAQAKLLGIVTAAIPHQGGRWGKGVYRAQELARMGIVPQAARLTCTTNCKCRLEDADRPVGRPHQKEQRVSWHSLLEKIPTMLRRETRTDERGRLAELAGKWEHQHVKRTEKS